MKKIRIVVVAMIMMLGIIVPSFICSAASVGETVSQSTEAALKAVDYYKDEKIIALLVPSRYSATAPTSNYLAWRSRW